MNPNAKADTPHTEGLPCKDWETDCPKRDDQMHCNCWYDGGRCCACGDDPATEEQKQSRWAKQDAMTKSILGGR